MALVDLAEADMHQAAGGQAKALRDQIEVVVVNPDGGEIIRHAEGHGVLRGFRAADGLEPHREHILREQPLEVAFDGFPEAGLEDGVGHDGTVRGQVG
jgi:hypothetical protein